MFPYASIAKQPRREIPLEVPFYREWDERLMCTACNEEEAARGFMVDMDDGDEKELFLCSTCVELINREADPCHYCHTNLQRDIFYDPVGVSGEDWTIGICLCETCITLSNLRQLKCQDCASNEAQWHTNNNSRVPRIHCDNCWKPYL